MDFFNVHSLLVLIISSLSSFISQSICGNRMKLKLSLHSLQDAFILLQQRTENQHNQPKPKQRTVIFKNRPLTTDMFSIIKPLFAVSISRSYAFEEQYTLRNNEATVGWLSLWEGFVWENICQRKRYMSQPSQYQCICYFHSLMAACHAWAISNMPMPCA